jgi:hypothetical protein
MYIFIYINICKREFIRLAYMTKDGTVPQWLSAGWRAKKTSICSLQDSGSYITK